jgi:TerB-C domain
MAKRLQAHVPLKIREAIGPVLVSLAAHDGAISPKELSALRSAYNALGLDPTTLDRLLTGTSSAPAKQRADTKPAIDKRVGPVAPAPKAAPAETTLKLDEARLQQILNETQDVAKMLGDAMSEDDVTEDEPEEAPPTVTSPTPAATISPPAPAVNIGDRRFPGLDLRFHAALAELLATPNWTKDEFETLARRHELMPSSLFDVVNEWAQDHLGDLILEERGEQMIVSKDLVPNP